MGLSSVTALGVIAFSCFKFFGNYPAFVFLKNNQPAIQANALLMGAARTVLGVLVGGSLYFGWDVLCHRFSGFYNFSYEALPYYLVLVFVRIFVWLAIIHFFSRKTSLRGDREWRYFLGGTLWSSFMDFPAALFAAFFMPGAFLFC